jgi:xanthine dehydrogenase accessory factor
MQLTEIDRRLTTTDAVLVRVARTEGSAPREAGTWMLVFADAVAGTIGGGQLEFQAIGQARSLLAQPANADRQPPATDELHRYPLGPSLGQCCGGVVHLRFERLGNTDRPSLAQRLAIARTPVALFGGGHVGSALVQVLSLLPCAITWIDSRDGIFPTGLPPQVQCEHSDPVHAAVADLAPGSQVLIMSFSHAEDLDIVAACLRRQREHADLPFIGLIGSKTKWATFRHRLAQRGFTEAELAQVTCPIGLPGIAGKEPEVIAVSVAAQLLLLRPSWFSGA